MCAALRERHLGDAPPRRGSACHPAGTARTADAPGCTGRGCASRRGHTCGVQPGHGRTSRSVWPPPWRAPSQNLPSVSWGSRGTNRGAWALWAPFHLLSSSQVPYRSFPCKHEKLTHSLLVLFPQSRLCGSPKRKATAGVAPRWLRLILLAILMIHYGATLIQYIELSCFPGGREIPAAAQSCRR